MIAYNGNYGHVKIEGTTTGEPGETIFIHKVGSGDRHVVLVPGNNCSGRVFHPLLRCFSENRDLHGKYTVHAPDYRGSGHSTYNTSITSLSDFARDFETALRMTGDFPDSGVALVGYSMGAAAAMEMMIENPAGYDALIGLAGVGTRGLRAAFVSSGAKKAVGSEPRTGVDVS